MQLIVSPRIQASLPTRPLGPRRGYGLALVFSLSVWGGIALAARALFG